MHMYSLYTYWFELTTPNFVYSNQVVRYKATWFAMMMILNCRNNFFLNLIRPASIITAYLYKKFFLKSIKIADVI